MTGSGGLRERNRLAVRREIAETALRLFAEQGFDATTMDQIAAAAGVARRTVFRYFPTKEDVVVARHADLGGTVRAALEARPEGEDPWEALEAAFTVLVEGGTWDPQRELAVARICGTAPSLRAHRLEKQHRLLEELAPEIARRMAAGSGSQAPAEGAREQEARARALVSSALACLDVAVDAWAAGGGQDDITAVYADLVAAVRA
ncbi:TetR/AcrR family transcriptional regulator [Kineococcus sp. NUM-3379]